MCGIAGTIVPQGMRPAVQTLQNMGRSIQHRGPDSSGHWIDKNVGLAHQRLSVLDLSSEGHQPMLSADGRYALVFNGEIYNYEELRTSLSSDSYHGRSDTEVLLQALIEWGVERTIPNLIGMFAFAFYDNQSQLLWLVRDRLGIKPLYYGWQDDTFFFASELRAIEAGVSRRPTISPDALALMMRHNHVPAPHCIYQQFHKLLPANVARISTSSTPTIGACSVSQYWSPEAAISAGEFKSDSEWQASFHDRLRDAVRTRLVSDVPLGGFLSGGIDSTLIVALMREQSSKSISTYTVGFEESGFNEAEFAKATAQHLGTSHHEVYVGERDVLAAVGQLHALCDEPFADQSILPTYLLCKMARQDVTVALSGDGGDEILWGYSRYALRERLDRYRNRIPNAAKPLVSKLLSNEFVQQTLGWLPTPAFLGRASRLADKLENTAHLLGITDENEIYRYLMSHWKSPTTLIYGSNELPTVYTDPPAWVQSLPTWRRMCAQDLLAYLPNDCLTKVDRASMAVGLEARVPLLDHRVVEMAYQLPEHLVRKDGIGKIVLRNILDEYVPREMMDRPKSGFGVPLGPWLRGPLREWASDLLSEQNLDRTGIFDIAQVTKLNLEHQAGTADWSAYLWDVLMFLDWDSARQA